MMNSNRSLRNLLSIALLMTVLGFFSCRQGDHGAGEVPRVTVSIAPQAYIVKAVGGDRVEVTTLIPQGANPESYEPTMSQLLRLNDSRAWLTLGGLGFEGQVMERIDRQDTPFEVVDVSRGIELMHGTHGDCLDHESHHHGGGDVDPHVWSSVKNMRILARNSYDALVSVAPENAAYYRSRLDSVNLSLDSLDNAIAAMLRDSGVKRFVVWHPSLSYFARDYGLDQIALGMDNKELSAVALRGKIDEASRGETVTLLIQRDYDSRLADVVNKEIGARVGYINPLNPDWSAEMISTARAISGKQ